MKVLFKIVVLHHFDQAKIYMVIMICILVYLYYFIRIYIKLCIAQKQSHRLGLRPTNLGLFWESPSPAWKTQPVLALDNQSHPIHIDGQDDTSRG